jgi:hypothetical protein
MARTATLTLAHGTNARRDRDRLVELSNAGTEWRNNGGTMRGVPGRSWAHGKLSQGLSSESSYGEAMVQLNAAQYVIYSYATPIAWLTDSGEWVVADATYSRTTARHQSFARALLS